MDDRTRVIRLLEDAFRNDPRVYALWLEGSDGLGRSDAYSDLDVWLDVSDGDEQAVLDACAAVLQTLRPIDFEDRTDNPHPKIFQRCLHLAGTSPYLLLDLCVQSHSRGAEGCTFVAGDVAEYPRVLFDKAEVVRIVPPPPIDPEAVRGVYRECVQTFAQRARVVKYLRRAQYLEAYAYYTKYVCQQLVTLFRLLYTPRHCEYWLVHFSSHMPADVREEVERLYQAASLAEIEERLPYADGLYARVTAALQAAYPFLATDPDAGDRIPPMRVD